MSLKHARNLLYWFISSIIVVLGVSLAAKAARPPADLNYALHKPTAGGHYIASLESQKTPVPVGAMHTWVVTVTTPAGDPLDDIQISIGGGMPQHGHGLPSRPRITKHLGQGKHLIEGMKFNMPGWWILTLSIEGAGGADSATFNLAL
ncbi:MAG: FixH family protein [Rhodospirillaceae bacterium]